MSETSLAAWAGKDPGPDQFDVLKAFGENGPGTVRDVIEAKYGRDEANRRGLWKRAPELVKLGLLEKTADKEPTLSTGKAGFVHRITEAGTAKLEALAVTA